jgi:hypothetical protein
LSLHFYDFSVIFGAIYKFLHFGSRSENSVLVNRSLVITDRPWDNKSNRNVVPGSMAGEQSSIPARGGLGPAGKVRGRHERSPGVQFRGSFCFL